MHTSYDRSPRASQKISFLGNNLIFLRRYGRRSDIFWENAAYVTVKLYNNRFIIVTCYVFIIVYYFTRILDRIKQIQIIVWLNFRFVNQLNLINFVSDQLRFTVRCPSRYSNNDPAFRKEASSSSTVECL